MFFSYLHNTDVVTSISLDDKHCEHIGVIEKHQKGPYPTGLLRRETYLCAIASGDGLRPLRAQSTIPILESTPNPYDPKSAKCNTSIKVVTSYTTPMHSVIGKWRFRTSDRRGRLDWWEDSSSSLDILYHASGNH